MIVDGAWLIGVRVIEIGTATYTRDWSTPYRLFSAISRFRQVWLLAALVEIVGLCVYVAYCTG